MNVLIIEDDASLSELLLEVLREEGAQATAYPTLRAGKTAALRSEHDVIVLDWMLSDGDGVALCQELRAAGVSVPILMLTARGEVADRVKGLRSGADDYLTKPFEVEELLARVEALSRRQRNLLRFGELTVDSLSRRVTDGERHVELTTKEFDLLLYLAQRRGQALHRSELLARVWGLQFDPGSGVVDVQIKRLRDKLGRHAELIETIRGVGYGMRG